MKGIKDMKKSRLFALVFALFALFGLTIGASAEDADYKSAEFSAVGFNEPENLSDGYRSTYSEALDDASVTVTRDDGVFGLYVEHDTVPKLWKITDTESGESYTLGTHGFLHEYVDVKELFGTTPKSLTLSFESGASICDIYAFSDGELPDFVQRWDEPLQRADLLLVSSHSDDEQLFFAGILPYYAGERGLDVQVIYMVQHFELRGEINHQRPHEQLDGLWAVGIRNYPVISNFPDLYAESTDREEAFEKASEVFAAEGVTYDDFVKYLTDNIRRFKPLVVVSHDLNGEYGHGTHVMCARALTEAVKLAADSSYDTSSVSEYGGAWCVNKLYLHLYDENQITLDLDTPLEAFGGKTAFEMTQYGFGFHKSQHWMWFNKWIYGTEEEPITRADQIEKYSPCKYGLYFTSVGYDSVGGDFFENVVTYAERNTSGNGSALSTMDSLATLPSHAEPSESAADVTTETPSDNEKRYSTNAITVIVIICVMVCVVIGIFIFYTSKTAAMKRRRRRRNTHLHNGRRR